MTRFEVLDRMAATWRRHKLLVPLLVLACLNAGVYAWSQGALAHVVWVPGLTEERPETEISPDRIQLLTPAEVLQLQTRVALAAQAAQTAAQAEAIAQAREREMVLEFEPAPTVPKRVPKAMQPIVKLKLKNPRV
jgi:hypothetical protein